MARNILTDLALVLQRHGDVEIDLTETPPTLIARLDGLVLAAAWPVEDGVALRLRLDTRRPHPETLDHVTPGALTFEMTLRDPEEVADVAAWLDEAHETTRKLREVG